MLFILSHPFRLRATPPAGRSGSRGGQADSRSSFLVKRTSPAAKRRPLATLFVSASAQAWFFVSSRNLRALGALRGFAVNPGLDFHREGAKHAKKARQMASDLITPGSHGRDARATRASWHGRPGHGCVERTFYLERNGKSREASGTRVARGLLCILMQSAE